MALQYRTMAAYTRRQVSVLVVVVVFLRAHLQILRFDKADATADVR